MEIQKKVNNAGAITIPSCIRRELSIGAGDKITMLVTESGKLVLQRNSGHCALCGSEHGEYRLHDKYVCRQCAEDLKYFIEADEAEEKGTKEGEDNAAE